MMTRRVELSQGFDSSIEKDGPDLNVRACNRDVLDILCVISVKFVKFWTVHERLEKRRPSRK